jgi:uncharacterized protein YjbJ (UPF0337 family)
VNFDEIKGKFKEWQGDLKAKWGDFTDDDWTEIGGEKDKLVGKIQQRYGRTKEEANREVDDFWRTQEERERRAS